MDTPKQALEDVIKLCNNSQSELARRVTAAGKKCSQQTVWWWLHKCDGFVGAEFIPFVLKAVNHQVSAQRLRPDLFPDMPQQKVA